MYGWIGKWTRKRRNRLNDWGTNGWMNDWTKYREFLQIHMQKSILETKISSRLVYPSLFKAESAVFAEK